MKIEALNLQDVVQAAKAEELAYKFDEAAKQTRSPASQKFNREQAEAWRLFALRRLAWAATPGH